MSTEEQNETDASEGANKSVLAAWGVVQDCVTRCARGNSLKFESITGWVEALRVLANPKNESVVLELVRGRPGDLLATDEDTFVADPL